MNDLKSDLVEAMKTLISDCTSDSELHSLDIMQRSQATLNFAHTLATLENIEQVKNGKT